MTELIRMVINIQIWLFRTIWQAFMALWNCDKPLAAFVVISLLVGKSCGVSTPLFWWSLLILVGIFGYAAYNRETLGLLEDYRDIFIPRLKDKYLNNNPTPTGGYPSGFHVPPRPDLESEPILPDQALVPVVPGNPGIPNKPGFRVTGNLNKEFVSKRGLDSNRIIELEKCLREKILGQEQAISAVVQGLRREAAGTNVKQNAPLSYLLVGPTGVGKTEMAKLVASNLKKPFQRYDMGSFKGKGEELWSLLGSPNGYIGGEGQLTSFVRSNPDAVLLFDEVEKAGDSYYDFMLGMIDDGNVKDMKKGEIVSFSKTTIFFTSNLIRNIPDDAKEKPEILRDLISAKGFFRPEFLARIKCICPFFEFSQEAVVNIIQAQLGDYLTKIIHKKNSRAEIECEAEVIEYIGSKVDSQYGARNVTEQIENILGNPLTDALLENRKPNKVTVKMVGENVGVEVV